MKLLLNKNMNLVKDKEFKRKKLEAKLIKDAGITQSELFKMLKSRENGLTDAEAEVKTEKYGKNEISYGSENTWYKRAIAAFINPFTIVLFLLALVSFIMDYVMAAPVDRDLTTVIIISTMVTISGTLRFIQEGRSNNTGKKLKAMIKTTANVARNGNYAEISISDIVPGDIIKLAAGDMIPADIRILYAKDLFVSQSSMTGESEPVEKFADKNNTEFDLYKSSYLECENLAFMGTNIISGTATAIVLLTGDHTCFGNIAGLVTKKRELTSFDKGVNSVSILLIKFMMIMVPIVFVVNGITKGDWMSAFLFGISIAVGLTPEMLPMIVTTNLAKGAVAMSKRKIIVKNLNSIENFGAMDILCTDKTGTLTEDKIILERHLDIHGNEGIRVLKHGYLVSYFQTGLKNSLDVAILVHGEKEGFNDYDKKYEKIDEIQFDFTRRRMSVVLNDKNDKTQLITKGAVEEMLDICSFAEYQGKVVELTRSIKKEITETVDGLNESGMRVIAVAQKTNPSKEGLFSSKDECDMVLIGYICFLDPPKVSAKEAIKYLKEYGVDVEYLKVPRKWDSSSIGSFMLWIGPTSSVFDITTYILMFFVICPMVCGGSYNSVGVDKTLFMMVFNSGWFVESLWSQTLVIHMIRSPKIPFIQSRASGIVIALTSIAILIGTIIPYTPFGTILGMYKMPGIYFVGLGVTIFAYMTLVTVVKKLYVRKYGELL